MHPSYRAGVLALHRLQALQARMYYTLQENCIKRRAAPRSPARLRQARIMAPEPAGIRSTLLLTQSNDLLVMLGLISRVKTRRSALSLSVIKQKEVGIEAVVHRPQI